MKKRLLTALAVLTGIFLLSASIVWAQPAPVAKTGQTTSYRTGDDGNLQKGVGLYAFIPRFTDNGDGTVTDILTGLMWAKDAGLGIKMPWNDAIDFANSLSLGNAGCGASHTDWRVPNIKELQSLIDFSNFSPALPSDHPFLNVQFDYYWSSTTYAGYNDGAWYVDMGRGYVDGYDKVSYYYIWPVRGGN